MSRIGSEVVDYNGVDVKVEASRVLVSGRGKELSIVIHKGFSVKLENNNLSVIPPQEMSFFDQKIWGTQTKLIKNAVNGIRNPFKKTLKIVGVGYKGFVEGVKMRFQLGLSHDKEVDINPNVNVKMGNPTTVLLDSHDKQALGAFAAKLCGLKKYNVYNGSGILDSDKTYKRKETKTKK